MIDPDIPPTQIGVDYSKDKIGLVTVYFRIGDSLEKREVHVDGAQMEALRKAFDEVEASQ